MIKFINRLPSKVTIPNLIIIVCLFILVKVLVSIVGVPSKIDFMLHRSDYLWLENELNSWKNGNVKIIAQDFVAFYPDFQGGECNFSTGSCSSVLKACWKLMSDLGVSYIERYTYAPKSDPPMEMSIRKEGMLAWFFWTSYVIFSDKIYADSPNVEFEYGRMSCKKLEGSWAVCTDR